MIHKHHRKRRSQGGDDSPINVIGLPDKLHEWVHKNPELAYGLGLLVKSHEDPAEVSITIPEQGPPDEEKPKRKKFEGQERRKRTNVTIKVPKDEEDGAGLYDERLEQVKEKLVRLGLYDGEGPIPNYEATMAAWHDWLDLPDSYSLADSA